MAADHDRKSACCADSVGTQAWNRNLRDEDVVKCSQSTKIVIVDYLGARVTKEVLLLLLIHIQSDCADMTTFQSTGEKIVLVYIYTSQPMHWFTLSVQRCQ